ncbi:PilN domain-containing protein [Marinicella sp. W31]|uniref:PilN domain-containing protein n=1 Tax=Marinicella sp. W31 TaxID=3023713 RepID=UPI00375779BB
MTAIADKILKPIQDWYQTSTIKEFSDWWLGELKTFIPDQYQQQLFDRNRTLLLTKAEDNVELWWQNQNGSVPYESKGDAVQDDWWHLVNHAQADEELDTRVQYLLDENECLIRTVALPTAALSDLDSVLTYEMDKYVPYPSNEVVFDYQIEKVQEGMEKTPVKIAVVHKKVIDRMYKNISSKGIHLAGIDINIGAADKPRALGVNLLDQKLRKQKDWSLLRFNFILAAVTIALLVFVMYNSIHNKQVKLESLSVEVDELKKQARTARELESRLGDSIQAANFLNTQRSLSPQIMSMVTELTGDIPENTYLTRIMINEDRIELMGQSDNANALVPILNNSSQWYTPQVSGQILPDARTGKEKFTIKADLKRQEEEDEDAAV